MKMFLTFFLLTFANAFNFPTEYPTEMPTLFYNITDDEILQTEREIIMIFLEIVLPIICGFIILVLIYDFTCRYRRYGHEAML